MAGSKNFIRNIATTIRMSSSSSTSSDDPMFLNDSSFTEGVSSDEYTSEDFFLDGRTLSSSEFVSDSTSDEYEEDDSEKNTTDAEEQFSEGDYNVNDVHKVAIDDVKKIIENETILSGVDLYQDRKNELSNPELEESNGSTSDFETETSNSENLEGEQFSEMSQKQNLTPVIDDVGVSPKDVYAFHMLGPLHQGIHSQQFNLVGDVTAPKKSNNLPNKGFSQNNVHISHIVPKTKAEYESSKKLLFPLDEEDSNSTTSDSDTEQYGYFEDE